MDELEPCPFCGADDAEILKAWVFNDMYYVQCYTCGCTTALFDTEEKAAEAWNRRCKND